MKTTVEISDAILARAKRLAARRKTSVRALIEEGLQRVLSHDAQEGFVLRDASFKGGRWLQKEFRDADWQRILDAGYDGRGT